MDRCSSPVLLFQIFSSSPPSPPPPSPPLFAQRLGAIIGAHVARCSNLCAVHTKDERHVSRVCRGGPILRRNHARPPAAHTQAHRHPRTSVIVFETGSWSTQHFLRGSSWTLRHFYWVLSLIGQTLDFGSRPFNLYNYNTVIT